MIKEDLSILPTDDLLDEMSRRFDSMVFLGYRENYYKKGSDNVLDRFHGDYPRMLGLCELLKDKVKGSMANNVSEADEGR